jgi:hypothetical protein
MQRVYRICGGCMMILVVAMVWLKQTAPPSVGPANATAADAKPSARLLAHNVYFALKDNSPQAKQALVDACKKYLSGHEGTVFFAAGVLAEDLNRPVNDRDFDVALHIIFKDKAAHDRYQDHPRHKQFIEENQANWKKVRVFDSYVEASP